jgi:hypothetical protein
MALYKVTTDMNFASDAISGKVTPNFLFSILS